MRKLPHTHDRKLTALQGVIHDWQRAACSSRSLTEREFDAALDIATILVARLQRERLGRLERRAA